MKIQPGYLYHIKDEFFEVANDDKLMQNKSSGSRPTLLLKSPNPAYWWAIPMTSKIEKAKKIKSKEESKYGISLQVTLGQYGGKDTAFLLQNMFLVPDHYISHIHRMNAKAYPVKQILVKSIAQKANRIVNLTMKGHKVTYTDLNQAINFLKENAQEREPREYHEHINEHLMAVRKAHEKEQAKEKTKKHQKPVKAYEYDD